MRERLKKEEAGVLIQGRKILRAKGMPLDVDAKAICEAAGISRKTGYKWSGKSGHPHEEDEHELHQEIARLKAENEELKKRYEDLRFENEGRKLAWEIHDVDEWIRSKKNSFGSQQKKKQ